MAHSEEDPSSASSSEGEASLDEEMEPEDVEDGEEEEEEEDGDYGDRKQGTKRRRKNKDEPASYFIDREAVVDEEEEEDEGEEEDDDFVAKEAEIASAYRPDVYRRKERTESPWSKTDEEIVQALEKRVRTSTESEEGRHLPKHQGKLPTINDKLWMVRCKVGKERITVMSLMQKFFEKQNTAQPVLIKSAIAPDHLKGYIYIEAMREDHVKSAIHGLRNLQEYGTKIVPIKEMPDVLSVAKKSVTLKHNDWVRVKRGIYKGDIGQVDDYDEGRGRVTIRLIPRLDLSDSKDTGTKKLKVIPPRRFFNYMEMSQRGEHIDKKGSLCIWNGNKFKDGYILKTINIRGLETTDVIPSLEELQKFQEKRPEQEGEEDDASRLPLVNIKPKKKTTFRKGDTVKAVEGDLKGLMGIVDSVEGNTVTVMPKHEELHELLNIPASQLQKYFKVGDHVKIISGRYEGETGLIVRLEGTTAIIFSDLTTKETQVSIDDIQECSDVTTGKIQLGGYELHDYVQINPQTVGVIVKVERDSFKVLDNNGNLQTILLQEIGHKRKAEGEAFDADQNAISSGDIVKIVDGPYKDRQGTIKYVYRYFAFVHSREIIENSGIFVVRTGYCRLVGGSKRKKPSAMLHSRYPASPRHMTAPPLSPGLRSPSRVGPRPSGFGGIYQAATGGSGGRRRREDALLNKTVIVTSGQWKGYVGIVKDATDTIARVELHTNCKTVTVNKDCITLKTEASEQAQFPPKTPMWDGSRTPMRDDIPPTPLRYPGTPSRTPGTPIHGTAWDPSVTNTPLRPHSWDYSDSFTPSTVDSISTPGSGYQPSSALSPYSPAAHHGTPGTSESLTPSAAYTPGYDTPGSGLGFGTPGSSFSERTPQDSTPGGYDTPGSGFGTPGGIDTPSAYPEQINTPQDIATPGGPEISKPTPGKGADSEEWITTDILVGFKSGPNANNQGILKSIEGANCQVEVNGAMIQVSADNLKPIEPKKNEKIKVIRGELRGSTGTLIGIDSADGIVRMNASNEIKILVLNSLARLAG